MKSIKQIKAELVDLQESLGSDDSERKFAALVRAGLFDPHKLTLLKRALNKENAKMTKAEREALIELLDNLLSSVLGDKGVYNKVKTSINETSEQDEDITIEEAAKTDFDITQVPPMIIMKRKAIRVFPDGQKVALYWADRINKYISVPFQSIGLSESLDEQRSDQYFKDRRATVYAARRAQAADDEDDGNEPSAAVQRLKADKSLDKMKKKYGDAVKARVQALGDKAEIAAKEYKEKKRENSWRGITARPFDDPARTAGKVVAKGVVSSLGLLRKKSTNKLPILSVKEDTLEEGVPSLGTISKAATSYAMKKVKSAISGDKSDSATDRTPSQQTVKDKSNGMSRASNEYDVKKGDMAFGGRQINTSNSWERRRDNNDAENRRQMKMQTAVNRSMSGRSTAISEENMKTLRMINETRIPNVVTFDDGNTLEVSKIMASKLTETYDAMNSSNKGVFLGMLNKDKESFMKLYNFSVKN